MIYEKPIRKCLQLFSGEVTVVLLMCCHVFFVAFLKWTCWARSVSHCWKLTSLFFKTHTKLDEEKSSFIPGTPIKYCDQKQLKKRRVYQLRLPVHKLPLMKFRARTQEKNLKAGAVEQCCLLVHSSVHTYLDIPKPPL